MIVDTVLTKTKAYIKQDIIECSIALEEGKIFKIGNETNMPNADQKIDIQGQLVLPGVIDPHVHLRDEERSYKETFSTGTAAAAAGGVTTVIDMPNNSPTTMSSQALRNRMRLATNHIFVNVGFYSEFPTNIEEIKNIVNVGAVGFKLFLAEQVGGVNIDDDNAIKQAFSETAIRNVPVAVHAEDHNMLKKEIDKLKLTKREDISAFLKAHDERIESVAINRMLSLVSNIENMRLHFCHLSTQTGIEAVSEAKKNGKSVSCEVTPHNLLLSKEDYEYVGVKALTMPPLRTKDHVNALWRGVIDNIVDCIGSDHAPHTIDEKEIDDVWSTKPGIPGLETTLPLMLTQVHRKVLSLPQAARILIEHPAQIFGLKDRGVLEPGKNADLVIVNFNEKFKIDASKFQSKAKFSPFNGWEVQGKPLMTFVNGQIVMENNQVTGRGGKIIIARGGQ